MDQLAAPRGIYRFGPFRLDAGRRILERDGQLVSLTPKAIDLLILLVHNAGQVVDKETLFQTVWPGTFVVESSLSRNICLVRKALDEPGSTVSVIQTVSKRGYRFTAEIQREALVMPLRRQSRPFTLPRVAVAIAATVLLAAAAVLVRRIEVSPAIAAADREYLVGRYMWAKQDAPEMQKALARFQKATQLDPNSALAWAGIADVYTMMSTLAVGKLSLNLNQARTAASRAVALNPRLAVSHVSLGLVRLMADFDPPAAEREYRQALELDPSSTRACYAYACLLAHSGRLAEARSLMKRAQELDPVSALLGVQAARIEYFDHRYARAIDLLNDVLERDPEYSHAHYYLAMCLGQLGRLEEASEHLRQARVHRSLLETDESWLRAMSGDRRPAQALLARRAGLVANHQTKPTVLVLPAIDAGEKAIALAALEQMWDTREIELLSINVDPRFDSIRSEPRFQALARRVWPGT